MAAKWKVANPNDSSEVYEFDNEADFQAAIADGWADISPKKREPDFIDKGVELVGGLAKDVVDPRWGVFKDAEISKWLDEKIDYLKTDEGRREMSQLGGEAIGAVLMPEFSLPAKGAPLLIKAAAKAPSLVFNALGATAGGNIGERLYAGDEAPAITDPSVAERLGENLAGEVVGNTVLAPLVKGTANVARAGGSKAISMFNNAESQHILQNVLDPAGVRAATPKIRVPGGPGANMIAKIREAPLAPAKAAKAINEQYKTFKKQASDLYTKAKNDLDIDWNKTVSPGTTVKLNDAVRVALSPHFDFFPDGSVAPKVPFKGILDQEAQELAKIYGKLIHGKPGGLNLQDLQSAKEEIDRVVSYDDSPFAQGEKAEGAMKAIRLAIKNAIEEEVDGPRPPDGSMKPGGLAELNERYGEMLDVLEEGKRFFNSEDKALSTIHKMVRGDEDYLRAFESVSKMDAYIPGTKDSVANTIASLATSPIASKLRGGEGALKYMTRIGALAGIPYMASVADPWMALPAVYAATVADPILGGMAARTLGTGINAAERVAPGRFGTAIVDSEEDEKTALQKILAGQ